MQLKGSLLDLTYIMLFLAVIVVGLIFGKMFSDELFYNSKLGEVINETEVGQKAIEKSENAFSVLNYGIVFIFIGIYITALILAYKMATDNLFVVFGLFLVIIFTFVAGVLSNILTDIVMSSEKLMNSAESMGLSFMIMNKLPYLIFFGGIFLLIVMYIGNRGEFE